MANTHFDLPPLAQPVHRLILGTSLWRPRDSALDDQLFDAYREAGGDTFDTALVYYDIENGLGDWVRRRGNRSEITIIAKVAHHETIYPPGATFEYHMPRVTPRSIRADLEESLLRLDTDYIDVLMLHRDDPDQPVEEILDCLENIRQSGSIRAYAASNWTTGRLDEAADYSRRAGLAGFAASSPQWSLAFANEPSWPNCVSACDSASREWYRTRGMPILAWSSLALGFFASDHRPLAELSESEVRRILSNRWSADVARVFYSDRNFERRRRTLALAKEKGVSATELALAWLLKQPLRIAAVVGPRSAEEVRSLFQALEISLSGTEMDWLEFAGHSSLASNG